MQHHAGATPRPGTPGLMQVEDPVYALRLATAPEDLLGAQRLRYRVFVTELGADGPLVDHAAGIERDEFDALFDHLVLVDRRLPPDGGHVVGAYRLLPSDRVGAGRFYSEAEFDLAPLRASGRRLLELGRTCVHPDHRGGAGMVILWNGLAEYVLDRGIEVLFGAASLPGTDPVALAQPLSWLYHHHLAPPEMRVRALEPGRTEMNLIAKDRLDRRAVTAQMPALIRAYLRLGGVVGDGAWIDRAFRTTDVCLVMDTAQMSARHREYYVRRAGG